MKKKFLQCVFAAAFCLSGGVFVASCDDVDNPVDNPSTDGETAYVVAATVGEASYLVAVSSLDEGTVSTKGKGTEVIGLARKKYKICAVCAVGMGQTGTQRKEIREKNNIPGKIPVFTLQENFSVERLHGMYKMMMNIMVKTAGKTLEKKTDRTPEEEDMLDMMLHGGERVKIQNLQGVISWYNGKR